MVVNLGRATIIVHDENGKCVAGRMDEYPGYLEAVERYRPLLVKWNNFAVISNKPLAADMSIYQGLTHEYHYERIRRHTIMLKARLMKYGLEV